MNEVNPSTKKWLVILAFLLFSILLIGAFYLFSTPGQTVNLTFAYVVGLSMIVLPCTLPLAFVIVPLAMGKEPKKGLLMAIYFGLGLAFTLSIYGLVIALIGKGLGLDEAIGQAGVVSKILFIIGGLAAFTFGLSELKLIRFTMPSYKGSHPKFIEKQSDYLKAFFLGLFLGNAGVGCPNPLFYVLLGDIAVVGNALHGWWLGFIHGIGRATPLVFLALLGVMKVNAVSNIAKKTAIVSKISGISLVFLGAFIFISGTSHQWYEGTIVHRGWNQVVELVVGDKVAEIADHEEAPGTPAEHGHDGDKTTTIADHEEAPGTPAEHGHDKVASGDEGEHGDMEDFIPAPWSWITLLLMVIIPLIWYRFKDKKKL